MSSSIQMSASSTAQHPLRDDAGGASMLQIPETVVRANSGSLAELLALKARQQWIMRSNGIDWWSDQKDRLVQVYDGMTEKQFLQSNAPQVWVEQRQIPRTLSGRVPARGAVVIDLGCGPGTSTATICRYAHASWRIMGIDLSENLVAWARRRASRGDFVSQYWGQRQTITPEFFHQSITDEWMGGAPLHAGSVDLVNSSGVVGHHLTPADIRRVIAEAHRVLRPGGYLALDTGPRTPARKMVEHMRGAGFGEPVFIRGATLDPRPKVVMRKP